MTISNADASRMGTAAEHLVAATCIIRSRAHLNVSTALIDDDGVDLTFHRRAHDATLPTQVKARFSDGAGYRRGEFRATVRRATWRPRPAYDLLLVGIDVTTGTIDIGWLLPSAEFDRLALHRPDSLRMAASLKADTADKWRPWRFDGPDIADRIMARIAELEDQLA